MNNFPLIEKKTISYYKQAELKNFFFSDNSIFGAKKQSTTALLNNKLNKKFNGYLYEIILFGLNYNAKRIKYGRRNFYVDLQKSHRILIDENIETPFRTRVFKRRLIFFGFSKFGLLNTIRMIKSKKPQNSYFGHGAIASQDKFKLKPGKIRQR